MAEVEEDAQLGAWAVGVKLLEKRREVLEGSLFLTTVLSRDAAHSYTESA